MQSGIIVIVELIRNSDYKLPMCNVSPPIYQMTILNCICYNLFSIFCTTYYTRIIDHMFWLNFRPKYSWFDYVIVIIITVFFFFFSIALYICSLGYCKPTLPITVKLIGFQLIYIGISLCDPNMIMFVYLLVGENNRVYYYYFLIAYFYSAGYVMTS